MTNHPNRKVIRIDTNSAGYAKHARCGAYHSGNHGLVESSRGYWQCQGCGAIYTAEAVTDPSDGELGAGGVIRV